MRFFSRNHLIDGCQSSRYKRKPHHKKKERDDSWREHKQIRRDKARRGGHIWGRRKRCYKKVANKCHRQWERDMISHERWDDLAGMDYTIKTHDPWDIY